MLSMLSLALAAAATALPPANLRVHILAGDVPEAAAVIERAARAAVPAAGRAGLAEEAFAPCFGDAVHGDWRNRCVRAALPDVGADGPVVAIHVGTETVSNVTGSVVRHSHTIHCVGPRGLGRIELNRRITAADGERIAADLSRCVSGAVAAEDAWAPGEDANGVRTWRFPVDPERLAESGPHARGQAPESALVEGLEAVTTHQNNGRCAYRGRIVHVESGRRLRRGDLVAIEGPCRWDGPDRMSRMFTQTGLMPGRSARIFAAYDTGRLLYLEAL